MNIKNYIEKVLTVVTCIMMVIMVVGALWQVFSRYVLNDPSLFTEELLRFMLIWTAMLGACYAFSTDKHLALIFIKNKFDGKLKLMIDTFIDFMTMFFAGIILVKGGLQLTMSTMKQLSPILLLPMGLVYSVIPLSGIIIIIVQILNIVKRMKKGE